MDAASGAVGVAAGDGGEAGEADGAGVPEAEPGATSGALGPESPGAGATGAGGEVTPPDAHDDADETPPTAAERFPVATGVEEVAGGAPLEAGAPPAPGHGAVAATPFAGGMGWPAGAPDDVVPVPGGGGGVEPVGGVPVTAPSGGGAGAGAGGAGARVTVVQAAVT